MPEERITTIKVKVSTRDRLANYGRKNETFDQVIIRLLDQVEAK